jgi:hypothetical protein
LAGAKLKRCRLTESGVTGSTSLTGLTSRIGHTGTGLTRRTGHARTALAGPRVRRGTGTRHALSWATLGRKSLACAPLIRSPLTRGALSRGTLSRGPLTWEILTRETLTWETLTWTELGLGLLAVEALDWQALARLTDVALHR